MRADGAIDYTMVEFGDGMIGLGAQGAHGAFSPKRAGTASQHITVHVDDLTAGLCGSARPAHFDGVTTVVAKLLNIVGPDVAFSATFYPLEEIAQVMRGWRDYTASAPNEVTSVCVSITFPANPELPEAVHDRPVVIDFRTDSREKVYPMVPAGNDLHNMIRRPSPSPIVETGADA